MNSWNLNNWQRKLFSLFVKSCNPSKIEKDDKVRCLGFGYPHWKNQIFTCIAVFEDGTIALNNHIRVSVKDFIKINANSSS